VSRARRGAQRDCPSTPSTDSLTSSQVLAGGPSEALMLTPCKSLGHFYRYFENDCDP